MKFSLGHIPKWVKNRYFIATAVFVVWVIFINEQNLFTTYFTYRKDLKQLEKSKEYYETEINSAQEKLRQLKSNPAALEKFAREKYLMKKENEDLFIIAE
jgi:cell division protein DivIC